MKSCAVEGCEYVPAWPSDLCFTHRSQARGYKKLGRPVGRPKTAEPRVKPIQTRLSQNGCDALVDDEDGWIVSCPGAVVWEAPPPELLRYCAVHWRERVAVAAAVEGEGSARSRFPSAAPGVAAPPLVRHERRLLLPSSEPRRDPINRKAQP